MARKKQAVLRPMRVQVRPGSLAERQHYKKSALPGETWTMPSAIAPGISPEPLEDLMFHGGKIVPQMQFQNIYLGSKTAWKESDITSIDSALTMALQFRALNNVMVQYFHKLSLSCDPRNSIVMNDPAPKSVDEPGVQALVTQLYDKSLIAKSDLDKTIFNLILPRGAVLKLDGSSSLSGLGGYHGSVHIKRGGKTVTLYYSANVYSEIQANGRRNGIPAFDASWKDVVATLYHETNEFRTDADVNDAIHSNSNDYLGWMSRSGKEVGDQPLAVATSLGEVLQEVQAGNGKKIPVQFLYSNAVHGAEGPIASPHA